MNEEKTKFPRGFSEKIKNYGDFFLDALFPPRCLLCKKEGNFLCPAHQDFKNAPSNKASFQYLDEIQAGFAYRDQKVEKLIYAFKYNGLKKASFLMAQKLAPQIPKTFWENSLVVPIPLHWSRKIWRGYNQSFLLAQSLQKHFSFPVSQDLKRIKKTKSQARLSQKERLQNLHNSFIWKGENLKGKNIILLDDVVATGTTLDQAACALKKSGAQKVKALVFARGGNL